MKRKSIVYTPEAADDLDWIYATVAQAISTVIANRYDARIRSFCERMTYGSERGTRHDDVRPGSRAIGFERRITVAFVVEAERVVILRLFYGGADWKEALVPVAAT